MSDDDDQALLERWRAGDRVAGNRLFDRHVRALMRFFRNKVDRGIEDLMQDTLLACVRGRDRLRDDGSFRAYLFATARFVLYEHVRRRQKADIDPETFSLADLGPGPSTAYAKHREQQILLQALQKLPMEYQVTLELYYLEGLSGPELAAALDIPEATVRSRLRRGSEKLRAHIETLNESPEPEKNARFATCFMFPTAPLQLHRRIALTGAGGGAESSTEHARGAVQQSQHARLPAFFQLDLRIERNWRYPKWQFDLFLDIANSTYSREIFQCTVGQDLVGGADPRGGLVSKAALVTAADPNKGIASCTPQGFRYIVPSLGMRGRF